MAAATETLRYRIPAAIGMTSRAAHVLQPWTHGAFANLKTWAFGVYRGLRRPHLQSYLDEFVFRFNRRRTRWSGPAARMRGEALGSG